MKPLNLTSMSNVPTEIYVEWNDIPNEHWNGPLQGYKVRYRRYDVSTMHLKIVYFGSTYTTLEGLKPHTLYLVEVSGYNEAGEGEVEYSITKTQQSGMFLIAFDIIMR